MDKEVSTTIALIKIEVPLKMKCAIERNSVREVAEFTAIISQVDDDVWLVGSDEKGHSWYLSAKSLLGFLLASAKAQKKRQCTAHNVDWNTLYCACDKDISWLIRDFAK